MNAKENKSLIVQDAVDRLKEYYPYNEEDKTFTISFHYDHLDDILVNKTQPSQKIHVNNQLLLDIENNLHSIPKGYHADIEITIDDYQGQEQDKVMKAINDTILDHQFIGSQELKGVSIRAGILALVGIFWILLSYAGQAFNWWGDDSSVTNNAISGILSIFAVVFGWEAVNTVIIHQNHFIKEFRHFIGRARYLSIKDNKGQECREPVTDIGYPFKYYHSRAVSEYCLMFSSYTFFAIAMLQIIRYFSAFFIIHKDIGQYELIIASIVLSSMIALGVFGVLIYKGYLKLLLPSAIINGLLLGASVTNLVLTIYTHLPTQNIVGAIITVASVIAFTVGLTIKYYLFKRKKVR